jgi:hypothetical protein
LELGAGVGVMGLSLYAAVLLRRLQQQQKQQQQQQQQEKTKKKEEEDDNNNNYNKVLPPSLQIVLTDCPAAVPLLQYNVEQNKDKLHSQLLSEGLTTTIGTNGIDTINKIQCRALDWTDRNFVSLDEKDKFDLILGSDILYNTTLLPALVQTMQENLKQPPHGKILLAVRWRKPDLERSFFQEMTQSYGIEWTLLSSAAIDCTLQWDEFGNPHCEKSNTYFCRRIIAVNGALHSLADIGEAEMELMSSEEYTAFEDSFIQVYLGYRKVDDDSNPVVPTTSNNSTAATATATTTTTTTTTTSGINNKKRRHNAS